MNDWEWYLQAWANSELSQESLTTVADNTGNMTWILVVLVIIAVELLLASFLLAYLIDTVKRGLD